MAFELRVKNWQSYLPIIGVVQQYRRGDFPNDLVAGAIVGIITVPQAVAYAMLAGLPPQTGLYACLVPTLVYTLLGSSRHLVVGPVAVAALMVAGAVGAYAPKHNVEPITIATILSLQSGLMLLTLRVSQMGGLVNLLSQPVIAGFVNAAAIVIIISQLGALTGIETGMYDNPVGTILRLVDNAGSWNHATLAIGACALVALTVIRYITVAVVRLVVSDFPSEHPFARLGPVVVAFAAGIAVVAMDLDVAHGVAVVGEVRGGLPDPARPYFALDLWLDLAPVAAMVALVAYVESFSIGSALATRQRARINSHQELIALGAANIGAAFTGAYPVAGSFSRSSVNYQAGARSPVSTMMGTVIVLLTVMFLTPALARLPQAVLAAIIIVSVVQLIDFRSLREQWRFYSEDAYTQIATLLTVLFFGVETGLLTGVGLSIAFFIRQSSRPRITLVGRIGGTEHFRAVRRYDVETLQHVCAVRIDENLYFANANQVETKLLKVVQRRPETQHLLVVCSAINMIDATGLEMLHRVNDSFQRLGIKLHLSEIKGSVMTQLEATDFLQNLSGSVFFTTDQAMRQLAERAAVDGTETLKDDAA